MTKLKIFKACALLFAVFSFSSCMKEEIFTYDDEWDNFIKRTKQGGAVATVGEPSSTPTPVPFPEQKHKWDKDIENFSDSCGDCFMKWMAYYYFKTGYGTNITNAQWNELVAIFLDKTPTYVYNMTSEQMNTEYYHVVGSGYTDDDFSRMQSTALGNKRPIKSHYKKGDNQDFNDFFSNGGQQADVIKGSGRKIKIDYGYVNAVVDVNEKDNKGPEPHSMIPIEYDCKNKILRCKDPYLRREDDYQVTKDNIIRFDGTFNSK